MPYPVASVRGKGIAVAWTPTDIAGLALWLKADAGLFQERTGASATTPAAADGDPVGTWWDWSGNVRHATAPADTKRSTKQTVSGHATIRWDAIDDWLATAAFSEQAQPFTVIIVSRSSNVSVGSTMFDGVSDTKRAVSYISAGRWYWNAGSNIDTGDAADTNINTHACIFSGASSVYRLNGVTLDASNVGSNAITGLSIGNNYLGTSAWIGDIYEVLVYSGALSAANLNLLGNYLERHGGIAWSDI